MKKFFAHFSENMSTLGETLEGLSITVLLIILTVFSFVSLNNLIFESQMTLKSYHSLVVLGFVFNIFCIAFFCFRINTLVGGNEIKVVTYDDIKKDNKKIEKLSLEESKVLFSQCIQEEDYLLAQLISNHINKLNGKISIN